jgi:CelD/BcsL family acetyltransferase involved in cellulose biosynthesis
MVLKSDIETELISEAADLEALSAEWQMLWERARSTTPFQSPEWLIPWCQIFSANHCRVLALRRHGRLVALFPWTIARRSSDSVRRIAFLGADERVLIIAHTAWPASGQPSQALHLANRRPSRGGALCILSPSPVLLLPRRV